MLTSLDNLLPSSMLNEFLNILCLEFTAFDYEPQQNAYSVTLKFT